MYIELDTILRETFADTQSYDFLKRRAAERGIFIKEGETAEQLRRRYMQSVSMLPFGGNIADYLHKAGSVEGVGGVKVTPAWNGGGTVLLTVADDENLPPGSGLVETIQNIIDPVPGEGHGLAPIGHAVTVRGAQAAAVNITASFAFLPGYSFLPSLPLLEAAAEVYFAERRAVWADEDGLIIRVSGLEQRFLAVPGVLDVTGTKLNGQTGNMQLGANMIPVLGSVEHV
jgi:uncharacterized phage protein gp47/JayE